MQKFSKLCINLVILGLLGGCSITTLPKNVRESIDGTESRINTANKKLDNAKTKKNENFITHVQSGFFGSQVILSNNEDILPPVFNNSIQMDKQFSGIRNIASSISDLTQIPTMVDLNNDSNSGDVCYGVRITQNSGNLIDLLNMIQSKCDIGWVFKNSTLVLSDVQTKTWKVNGIPGDIQVQNQIQNQTGIQSSSGGNGSSIGSGSGGGATGQSQATSNQTSTQNTAFNLQSSIWNNLKEGIQSILSKNGKLSISPSTSSLTVTDKPSVLLRVDQYVRDQNATLKKTVVIDVQVYNVDVFKEDNYGINWNMILKGTNASFSINGQAVVPGATGGTSAFTPSPIFVPTNTTQAFTVGANSGDLTGSSLIINALSSQTKASQIYSTAVTTVSNQPVPVQSVEQTSYLSSVTTTVTGTSPSTQTSLTPGQLTTGFSMNILPVVEDNNLVNLQVSFNLSMLKTIKQFSSNGSSIELPETVQRNIMQKVRIKSGDTYVVTSFDANSDQLKNSGVGGIYNWILGGGVSASNTKTKMVILLTPRIMSNS